jgi:hypothetical protein
METDWLHKTAFFSRYVQKNDASLDQKIYTTTSGLDLASQSSRCSLIFVSLARGTLYLLAIHGALSPTTPLIGMGTNTTLFVVYCHKINGPWSCIIFAVAFFAAF